MAKGQRYHYELQDTAFTWIGKDRKGRRGGGVGFMVKDNLNPKKVSESRTGNELWIYIGRKDIWFIAVVYIPPADNNDETCIQSFTTKHAEIRCQRQGYYNGGF